MNLDLVQFDPAHATGLLQELRAKKVIYCSDFSKEALVETYSCSVNAKENLKGGLEVISADNNNAKENSRQGPLGVYSGSVNAKQNLNVGPAGPYPVAGSAKEKNLSASAMPPSGVFICKLVSKKDHAEIQKFRNISDFIAVLGSSPEICAWAANSKGVDLLLQPFNSEKCFLDLQTTNVLRDKGVSVAFLFSEFLDCDGLRQSQLLKNASSALKLCEKAGSNVLFFSGAKNAKNLRAVKDLSSFAVMLGMKKEAALRAVRQNASVLLDRAKKSGFIH